MTMYDDPTTFPRVMLRYRLPGYQLDILPRHVKKPEAETSFDTFRVSQYGQTYTPFNILSHPTRIDSFLRNISQAILCLLRFIILSGTAELFGVSATDRGPNSRRGPTMDSDTNSCAGRQHVHNACNPLFVL